MKNIYSAIVRSVMAAQVIEKGNVRNTVLRQIKALKRSISLLEQGRDIKKEEINTFKEKNPEKARALEKQVDIIESGLKHLHQAIRELDKYKETSVI